MAEYEDKLQEKRGLERLQYLTDSFIYHIAPRKDFWDQYREDLELHVGDHWDETQMIEMDRQNKPALTFNHIPRQVNLLTGYERTERKNIIARPIGSEDVNKAAIVTGAIRHIDKASNAEYERTEASENCFIMGEGILSFLWDGDEGRYRIASESPFSNVPDRDCYDRTWTKSRVHFRFKWMSKAEMKRLWPEKKTDIDDINPNVDYRWTTDGNVGEHHTQRSPAYDFDYLRNVNAPSSPGGWSEFYDEKAKKWRVIEAYEAVVRPVSVIYEVMSDGTRIALGEVPWHIDENGEIVEDNEKITELVEGSENFEIDEVRKNRWRLTVFAGDVELDDGFTRYARNPFVPYICYMKHDGDKKWVWGFVRKLRDPQLAYNKIKSQMIYALNKSVGNIILVTKRLIGSLGVDRFQDALNNFNDVVVVDSDSVEENKDWGRLTPNPVPPQLFESSDDLAKEMFEIGGIDQQAMMGMTTKGDPSGWALELKQKQGALQIASPFDAIRESNIVFYRDLVWPLIKGSNIKERVRRELLPNSEMMGDFASVPLNFKPSEMRSGEQQVMSQFMPPEDVGKVMALDEVFNPLVDLDVDIVFDDTNFTTTERMRILTMLLKMAEMEMPIPPELIIEFTDDPVREKILDYMRQAKQNAPHHPAP